MGIDTQRIRKREAQKLATTTYANEIADVVNGQNAAFVVGCEETAASPGLIFLAKVTDAGPAAEADFADERHWCIPQIIKAGVADAAADFDDWHSITPKTAIPVTNFAARAPGGAAGSGAHALVKDSFIFVRAEVDKSSPAKVRYVVVGPPMLDGVPFMVDLTQTGGSAGDASTLCSFTYTVKRIGSTVTIGTSMSPEASFARTHKMTASAASRGQAYWHAGALVLTIAYEVAAGTKPCTTA